MNTKYELRVITRENDVEEFDFDVEFYTLSTSANTDAKARRAAKRILKQLDNIASAVIRYSHNSGHGYMSL